MFYHNTTTEPTVMPETGFFYNQYCFGVFCIGFSIFFTEIVLKYIKITDSYDDDKVEEVEEEVEEDEIYTDKYIDEFNLLNERILTDLDYLNLKKNSICETTPGGIVLLNYNKETDGFCYYTDKLKEITYDILETVARKFVIEYNSYINLSVTCHIVNVCLLVFQLIPLDEIRLFYKLARRPTLL